MKTNETARKIQKDTARVLIQSENPILSQVAGTVLTLIEDLEEALLALANSGGITTAAIEELVPYLADPSKLDELTPDIPEELSSEGRPS